MKRIRFCAIKTAVLFLIPVLLLFMTSCYSSEELAYYAQESNYISATGTVSHIKYTDDRDELYLAFSDLSPGFADRNFRIVGGSLAIVQERGIDEKLQLGNEVTFISAPRYLGDGYVIPIVEITVDGETLLEFSEGFADLQEWLVRR